MHRYVLTLLLSGLLLIAACTRADVAEEVAEEASPTAAPTVEPTPTLEPSPTPEPTATPEPEPTPTPVYEEEAEDESDIADDQGPITDDFFDGDDAFGFSNELIEPFHDEALAELLISMDDMPAGWEIILEGSFREDGDLAQGTGDLMAGPCGNDPLDLRTMNAEVNVGRAFSATIFGPFFSHDLVKFEDSGAAAAALELGAAQYECGEWTEREPLVGLNVRYTVEELELPEFGDQMIALSIKMELADDVQAGAQQVQHQVQMGDPFDGLSTEIILIRHDHLLMSFVLLDVIGHGGLDLEQIISIAVEKVASAH